MKRIIACKHFQMNFYLSAFYFFRIDKHHKCIHTVLHCKKDLYKKERPDIYAHFVWRKYRSRFSFTFFLRYRLHRSSSCKALIFCSGVSFTEKNYYRQFAYDHMCKPHPDFYLNWTKKLCILLRVVFIYVFIQNCRQDNDPSKDEWCWRL